jgi:hypothetical protein
MRINADLSRTNAELSRALLEKFPNMMEAAATLLLAADGAGLAARLPMARPDDRDDDDDDDDGDDNHEHANEPEGEPEKAAGLAGLDLNALIKQLLDMLPVLAAGFGGSKLKLPGLASVLDWRKAAPTAAPNTNTSAAPAEAAPAEEALPPLAPAAMAHVIAIQSQLEPGEVAHVQAVAKDLSPAELRAWFDELSKLSVPEAVTRIRGLIAGKNGGAS